MSLLPGRADGLQWDLKLSWSPDSCWPQVSSPGCFWRWRSLLKWSDSLLLEEEESGFPHKETCPARFSGFYTRDLEKHLVTEMLLKSLPRSRGPPTFKSLARLSRGPYSVWKEVRSVLN